MNPFPFLSATAFWSLVIFAPTESSKGSHSNSDDCNALQVTYEVKAKESEHSLDILVVGGKEPFKIILSMESGSLLSKDFTEQHYASLRTGIYYCTVIDAKNCKKNIEITIP